MILEIHVRNVALIQELTWVPGAGLTVMTGETGAGKSILLGAFSLLLGERASAEVIRAGCESAAVEALFDTGRLPNLAAWLESHGLPPCPDQTLVLKREISRGGRGKCYVNGSLTTLSLLQELGQELVDLHGQHEHQSLLVRSRQRDLLDAWAGLLAARDAVAAGHARLQASREARERLSWDEAERMRRLDVLNFQIEEIDGAAVTAGEMDGLQEERGRLANAERLVGTVESALDTLHRSEQAAVRDGLAVTADALAGLARFDSRLAELADRLRGAEAQVADVVDLLSEYASDFEADPARLEAVEERLDLLHKLQRKYGDSEEAILAFREKAAAEREGLAHQDEELERLAREEAALTADLEQAARKLSSARQQAGQRLARRLETELKQLGFARAAFEVRVGPREDPEGWLAWDGRRYRCTSSGVDEVEFFISPNPGEEPKPVAKIASGGELSRIMLALKVVAAAEGVPTMIFDEIDAGIGGVTADAVGRKLAELAASRQVVVITHLPQITRFAQRHFQVAKSVEQGRTVTAVRELNGEDRVQELARLMAGERITETALQHARELIQNC